MGIKRSEYEASNGSSRSKEEGFELMKAIQFLITRDNSAIAWAKRKNAHLFCIPTPELEECMKAIQQGGTIREGIFLRALLELYQDMLLQIPTKKSNDP